MTDSISPATAPQVAGTGVAQMNGATRQRVLLAKVGLDGHDRGIKVIARGLRDAGFHVIYAGIWQSPEAVAQAVADEDADWLGISLLSGAHMSLIPRVLDQLRIAKAADVGIVLGGIIPPGDASRLKKMGVATCFGPGTQISEIVPILNARPRPQPGDVSALVESCRARDRRALSRLITHLADGVEVEGIRAALSKAMPDPSSAAGAASKSRTIAFTGSPGVGKSSLIARLLPELRRQLQNVAVLSCDPQSPITGGALLGDRIRMAETLPDPGIYIRSLAAPSGGQGIVPNLDLMTQALELAGFSTILIETVGTGQGDVAVRNCAQTVVALLQAETGDAVQWEKAGLLEIADVIVIHKSDLPGSDRLAAELRENLHLPGFHSVPLVPISAADPSGLDRLMTLLALTMQP